MDKAPVVLGDLAGEANHARSARLSRRGFMAGMAAIGAASAVGAISGCAPRPATGAEPATLRIELANTLPPGLQPLLAAALREQAGALGCRVEVAFAGPLDLIRRLDAPDSALPDIALTTNLGPARLGWGTSLADVSDRAERLIRQNGEITLSLRRSLTDEKKLWAIPLGSRSLVWLMRNDLADLKGVATPNTFAELADAAGKLADAGRGVAGLALPLARSAEGEALVHQVLVAFGGALAGENGLRVGLASAESVDALTFLADLARRGPLPTDRATWSGEARDAVFFSGKVALAPVSAEGYARRLEIPGALGAAASYRVVLPPAGPKRRVVSPDGFNFVVSRRTPWPDLAGDLIAGALSLAHLRDYMKATPGAFVPAYADLTHDPFWDVDPVRQGFAQSARGDMSRGLEAADAGFPGPATAGAAEVSASLVLSEALRQCVEDGVTPDAAIKQAQQKAVSIYDRVGRDLAALRRANPR